MHFDHLAASSRKRRKSARLGLLLLFLTPALVRGEESKQFLPEIDIYYLMNPFVRMSFQAKQTREARDPTQAEIGPSIDLYLKPWIKLQNATLFDLDQAKKRALVFSTGYRVLASPGDADTNRWEIIATGNLPLRGRFIVSDRNRADLDWQNGKFNWRYRNRLSVERAIRFNSYHPKLYVQDEEFYESQYHKWSTTALYAGGTFPVNRHLDLGPYYCHQNNSGKSPNQQLDQIGLIVNIYIPPRRK